MPTFNEDASQLRANSFLSGLAKLGQAIKEERQHESLIETYNKFKAEKEGLLTTQEQIDATNKKTSLFELPSGEEIPSEVRKFVDVASNVGRIEALQTLYQPYIDAMILLGDEGKDLAFSLSQQLADKISLEEKRAELPFQQLKWLNRQLEYNWNLDKYDEYLRDVILKREVDEIVEYMVGTNTFSNLPPDRITYHTEEEKNRIAQLENNVLREATNKFTNVSQSSVVRALKLAKDLTGRQYTYFELTPRQMNQAPVIAYGGYLTSAQAWTDKWIKMNEGYRNALKTFMSARTPPPKIIDPITGESVFLYDFDTIKTDAEIYKEDGLYMNAWVIMASNGSPFVDLGVFEEITLSDGNKMEVPINRLYKSLIHPTNTGRIFHSFIEGNFRHNPIWAEQTIAAQIKRANELGDDTLPIGDDPEDINIFGEGGTIDKTIFEFFTGRDILTGKRKEQKEEEDSE